MCQLYCSWHNFSLSTSIINKKKRYEDQLQ